MTTTLIQSPAQQRPVSSKSPTRFLGMLRGTHVLSWLLIVGALVTFSLFAVQTFRVPQAHDYLANWHGAQWI